MLFHQVELYTHHECVRDIFSRLSKKHHLVAVHLVDSLACRDAAHFVAVTMTSLSAMIRLELPHVNILSKVSELRCSITLHSARFDISQLPIAMINPHFSQADTLELNERSAESVASSTLGENCRLPFNLDYFTEVLDMRYLTDMLMVCYLVVVVMVVVVVVMVVEIVVVMVVEST